ncbi:MAG TPA: sulfatase-like hydrolase/transferase [Nitrospinota bacterium]|nr:sulfatase-like hydrolase/transferase [Nitrospinota bacterium]
MKKSIYFVFMLLALVSVGCSDSLETGPADVVIITVDTLRVDRLGIYGYKFIQTPNIDGLGKHGVVFEQARVPVPITLPSHTSIFTGLYPPSHGVLDNGKYKAAESLTTLPEIFKKEGYNTGAVVGSFVLDRRFGLNQGFDYYDDSGFKMEKDGRELFFFQERSATEVTEHALKWLKSLYVANPGSVTRDPIVNEKEKRFFLWVHYFDPHALYNPPDPYASKYKDSLYDGEIAYTDEQIGRLIDGIRKLRGKNDLIIVLTSDHGESLGDHGEMTHGIYLYDSTVQIPLIISAPDRIPAHRVPWRVRSIDIAPTLLELVGIEYHNHMDGSSLVPLIKGNGKSRDTFLESAYARLHFGWSELRGLAVDGYTVIDSPKPELYSWEDDPRQVKNLAQKKPELLKSYLERLNRLLKTLHKTDMAAQARGEMSNETMQKIEALGYLSLVDPRKADSVEIVEIGGINPTDQKFFQYKLARVAKIIAEKKYDQGLVLLDEMLESDPRNNWLLMQKGTTYLLAGEKEKSRQMFLQILEQDAHFVYALEKIAWLEFAEGNLDKAENYCRKAIGLYQDNAEMYNLLSKIMVTRDDWPGAKKMLQVALDKAPSDIDALLSLGALLFEEMNYSEARKLFEDALRQAPNNIDALNLTGETRLRTGDRVGAIRAYTHAAELAPLDGMQQYYLGLAYEFGTDSILLGPGSDSVAAQSYYQRALELNPDIQHAKDRLNIFNKTSVQKSK